MNLSLQLQHCNCTRSVKLRPSFKTSRLPNACRHLAKRRRNQAAETNIYDEEDEGDVLVVEDDPDEMDDEKAQVLGLMKLRKIREDRYRLFVFEEEEIEALISETESGLLDLSQTYLYEDESGVIARPDLGGDIPDGPKSYKVLEWDNWVSGDVMSEIEEKTVLKKVYFITEIDGDKFCPDFFNSYCLDASQRLLSKCKVIDESDGSDDPVMRILPDKIVLQDSFDAPRHEQVSEDFLFQEMLDFEAKLMKGERVARKWNEMPKDYKGTVGDFILETASQKVEGGEGEGEYKEQEDEKVTEEITGVEKSQRKTTEEEAEPSDILEEFDGGLDDEPDVPEVDSV